MWSCKALVSEVRHLCFEFISTLELFGHSLPKILVQSSTFRQDFNGRDIGMIYGVTRVKKFGTFACKDTIACFSGIF